MTERGEELHVETHNIVVEGTILPPANRDACQLCAREHVPEQPHDRDSLHYQYTFYHDHMRWPAWSDAVAHCTPEVQKFWLDRLEELNVPHDQLYAEI